MKRILIFSLCAGLFPVLAQATIRPVVSIAAGADRIGFNMNQNITLIAPFQNNYNTNIEISDFVGGLFLGIEAIIWNNISGQLGVSFYQNAGYEVEGTILQFGEPILNDTGYQYYIQSQRVFLETKILAMVQDKYHPFVTAGIGRTINRAYGYNEIAFASSSVPMVPGYGDHTTHSPAYFVGIGVEMDMSAHNRLGVMYRYSRLGNARLNTSPLEEGTQTLQNNALHVNEFLLQFSYVG